MTKKVFFTALLSGACVASLFAQAPEQYAATLADQSGLTTIIDNLHHIALSALAGAIVFAGILFIFCVVKACSGLSRSRNKIRSTFAHWIMFAGSVCAAGSSCTPMQQAWMDAACTTQATETRHCPINHDDYWAKEIQSNRYAYYGPNHWNRPVICRYCGKRITNGLH